MHDEPKTVVDSDTIHHVLKLKQCIRRDQKDRFFALYAISDYLEKNKENTLRPLHPSIQTAYEALLNARAEKRNGWLARKLDKLAGILGNSRQHIALDDFYSALEDLEVSASRSLVGRHSTNRSPEDLNVAKGFMTNKIIGAMAGHGFSDGNEYITANEIKALTLAAQATACGLTLVIENVVGENDRLILKTATGQTVHKFHVTYAPDVPLASKKIGRG